MKKYLLSFLLISLTIIGDGYAGSCVYFAPKSECKANDHLCLKYNASNGYEYRFTCDTSHGETCGQEHYVIVAGPHSKGDSDTWTTAQLWHCVATGDDHWEVHGQNITNVPQCSTSMSVNEWILGLESIGYDVYVKKGSTQSSYFKNITKAYSFGGEVGSHLCKLKTDKKCGRRAFGFPPNDVLFCREKNGSNENVVNVYQSSNARWNDITKDMKISYVCGSNPSDDNDWKDWGKWKDTGFKVFVKEKGLSSVSDGGMVFINGVGNKDISDARVCLWCADEGMEPERQTDGAYKCVGEPEPEPAPETEPEPAPETEPDKKCGVPCDEKKTIYCLGMPDENDSSVFYCSGSGQNWQEIDAQAWCCNKKCTPPSAAGFADVGIWTGGTGHHLYVKRGAISSAGAYSFYSEIKDGAAYGYSIEENCTACPDGMQYSPTNKNCVSIGNDIQQNNSKM